MTGSASVSLSLGRSRVRVCIRLLTMLDFSQAGRGGGDDGVRQELAEGTAAKTMHLCALHPVT
jgi:hypothetical protein